ncbi:MAG: hypothetical protein LBN06_00090 [Prevotellaceae bacterium]|jgi:hypothetical protein|nr:hypothetical protein [Prevotellaceae bacterium]
MIEGVDMKRVYILYAIVLFTLPILAKSKSDTIVAGRLFGRPLFSKVDCPMAAKMLSTPTDSGVVNFLEKYRDVQIDNKLLENISKSYSLDVSTIFLLMRLYSQHNNHQLQNIYMNTLKSLKLKKLTKELVSLKEFHIVFIPGFNYNNNRGNLLEQKQLLDSADISYTMINLQPIGLIKTNAQILADELKIINQRHSNIILISISKGSMETALSLTTMLNPDEVNHIKAWINVCGTLKGSPVADYWRVPFRRFWLSLGLWFIGRKANIRGLTYDLSYLHHQERWPKWKIPKSIYTITLLSTPLGREKKGLMKVPNDNYSPLIDEIIDGGNIVVEVGYNHTLEGMDLNPRMVALLNHIAIHLKKIKEQ